MKKSSRCFTVAIFLIDIAVLLFVVYLLWTMTKATDRCERLCLPGQSCGCRANSIHTYLRKIFVKEFEATIRQEKKYATNLPKHFVSVMKPKARLGGANYESIEDGAESSDLIPLKHWRDDGNNMYISNGISHRNGRLRVPFKGLYHIYSYIDMHLNEDENKESQKNKSFRQAIFKSNIKALDKGDKNSNEESMLLESFAPYEITESYQRDIYSTFLSADIPLEAGDEIYIKICSQKYIKFPSQNYFGIHLL